MKFAQIRDEINHRHGTNFRTLAEVRKAGYRIVKERQTERYFLAKSEELHPLLVRLGDIAEVRRGITTGANEFFYLIDLTDEMGIVPPYPDLRYCRNGAGWQGWLEERFLKPVIKSPREVRSILVRPEELRYKLFMCHQSKPELQDQGYLYTLDYIAWGEEQGYDQRPSCRSRARWWDLGEQDKQNFILLRFRDIRNWTPILHHKIFIGDIVFTGRYIDQDYQKELNAILNSTLQVLITEIFGRVNLGDGLLTTYGPEISHFIILDPIVIKNQREQLYNYFEALVHRDVYNIFEESGLPRPNRDFSNIHPEDVTLDKILPDRRALDSVVFEALGLTEAEQLELYRAVVELVKKRLSKARSV